MAFQHRILLVEDHQIVRDGLRACLAADPRWLVVGECADAGEVSATCEAVRPDLVLLDIAMPGGNGIDVARRLLRRYGDALRVVILSAHDEPSFVREALHAGARGYVNKASAFAELATALSAVVQGRIYVSPSLSASVARGRDEGNETDAAFGQLSVREREVLQLLAEGLSSKECGAQLGISHKTVHVHRANLKQKLGLQSEADLVKYAIRAKLTSTGA